MSYPWEESGGNVNLWQVPVFLNGVYTFNFNPKFKPFLGAGAGGIATFLEAYGFSESDFTFGYQGMAGLKYAVADKVDLGLTYKFLGTLDHDFDGLKTDATMSHSFLAALTIRF